MTKQYTKTCMLFLFMFSIIAVSNSLYADSQTWQYSSKSSIQSNKGITDFFSWNISLSDRETAYSLFCKNATAIGAILWNMNMTNSDKDNSIENLFSNFEQSILPYIDTSKLDEFRQYIAIMQNNFVAMANNPSSHNIQWGVVNAYTQYFKNNLTDSEKATLKGYLQSYRKDLQSIKENKTISVDEKINACENLIKEYEPSFLPFVDNQYTSNFITTFEDMVNTEATNIWKTNNLVTSTTETWQSIKSNLQINYNKYPLIPNSIKNKIIIKLDSMNLNEKINFIKNIINKINLIKKEYKGKKLEVINELQGYLTFKLNYLNNSDTDILNQLINN